jgi:hypothetical protein
MAISRIITAILIFASATISFTQFGASMKTVRYRTLASGTSSTFTQAGYRIAGDSAVFENYWQQFLRQNSSVPTVDFTKDRVVIFFLGQRSSGGYTASVRGIFASGGATAEVSLSENTPMDGAMNTMAMTQPWVAVAVDRSYLDFNLKVIKVQTPPPSKWIQTGPLSSFLPNPCPWTPCFDGYGGDWSAPCGYLFDDWYGFDQWGVRNNLNYNRQMPGINWRNQRLVCVSAGQFGLGFDINVLGVQLRGNVGVVQLSRKTRSRTTRDQRIPFTTFAVQREIQQIQVEIVEDRSTSFIYQGDFQQYESSLVPQVGNYLMTSSRHAQNVLGGLYTQFGNEIQKFDYRRGQLVIVNPGVVRGVFQFEGVIYRGNQAVCQFSQLNTRDTSAKRPFYCVRIESGISAITIEIVKPKR